MRADKYLVERCDYTRSQIKKGKITVNGNVVKAGYIVKEGDDVQVELQEEVFVEPEDIKIDVVHEDDHLMIINKPRGMVVHPGAGNRSGTLLNGLLSIQSGDLERAGIVHRLDKNTAGLMVVAKDVQTMGLLSSMFERKDVKRVYIGLVEGVVKEDGIINKNIIRDTRNRVLFTTGSGGRRAITHYKVLRRFTKWTLVEFRLETGRTHQIRVHAKSIGHPLVGDPEYNPRSSIKFDGQLLESVEIEFLHPVTEKNIVHKIKPSEEFDTILKRLV